MEPLKLGIPWESVAALLDFVAVERVDDVRPLEPGRDGHQLLVRGIHLSLGTSFQRVVISFLVVIDGEDGRQISVQLPGSFAFRSGRRSFAPGLGGRRALGLLLGLVAGAHRVHDVIKELLLYNGRLGSHPFKEIRFRRLCGGAGGCGLAARLRLRPSINPSALHAGTAYEAQGWIVVHETDGLHGCWGRRPNPVRFQLGRHQGLMDGLKAALDQADVLCVPLEEKGHDHVNVLVLSFTAGTKEDEVFPSGRGLGCNGLLLRGKERLDGHVECLRLSQHQVGIEMECRGQVARVVLLSRPTIDEEETKAGSRLRVRSHRWAQEAAADEQLLD